MTEEDPRTAKGGGLLLGMEDGRPQAAATDRLHYALDRYEQFGDASELESLVEGQQLRFDQHSYAPASAAYGHRDDGHHFAVADDGEDQDDEVDDHAHHPGVVDDDRHSLSSRSHHLLQQQQQQQQRVLHHHRGVGGVGDRLAPPPLRSHQHHHHHQGHLSPVLREVGPPQRGRGVGVGVSGSHPQQQQQHRVPAGHRRRHLREEAARPDVVVDDQGGVVYG
eukprot:CAMPEP_0118906338 /NCGR_PEP_ID=MMETSP1166-20130328/10083_1 /TAXON_ID=1104430 /ORGANISM="Chrysoreinhardia sp, Strain CCMP3193" /LENGTH=221 /DNA_ID=CAMNT_0006845643 /DNA_START=412 /DNA_END=1073 /DNA_ORIENTATION=-